MLSVTRAIAKASPDSAMYLDLLKKCLTRSVFDTKYRTIMPNRNTLKETVYTPIRKLLASRQLALVRLMPSDPVLRKKSPFPNEAETMIPLRRLDNLQNCITDVIRQEVPGDLIETGVWRGGATIFMRAVLKVYGETERIVWAADSFEGVPKPDLKHYPADKGSRRWSLSVLQVSLDEVKENFARYGLLDDQVRFLVGWFRDTLPSPPIDRLAVLRLDGVIYESTMEALIHLYPKLSVGGYIIIDDYGDNFRCRAAVEDFRAKHGISEELKWTDQCEVFWQRT
jgi:O-methyltransferase